jgi:hypothetical protein
MNMHPIEQAALAASSSPAASLDLPTDARETLVRQAAALARQLADVMLANVQNTASLNLSAARAVLAHARIPTPPNLQHRSDTWRHSWRSFEICATSADQMLNLARGHVERTTAALWRTTERLLDEMPPADGAASAALRDAFNALRAAQAACWQATQQVHHELVSMAQAPLPRSNADAAHGTH